MRLLLVTGGFHPFRDTTPILTECLRDAGHTVRVTKAAKELSAPSLSKYHGIILNTWRRNHPVELAESLRLSYPNGDANNDFSDTQRTNLREFVAEGGGLISLHISADSCPNWPEMKRLTGGGYVTGISKHGPFGRFRVHVKNPKHPVAEGITDFDTDDELYLDMDLQPDIDVFLSAYFEGEERPLGWSTIYGDGKVVNISLGHSGVSVGMQLDGHAKTCLCPSRPRSPFQQLILNAIEYVG